MNVIQSALLHKISPPRRRVGDTAPGLILLHGLGANEDDLLGLADYLDERFFIVSPRAPFPYGSNDPQGRRRLEWGGGFTWYDLMEVGRPEPKMFAESYGKLTRFLGEIVAGYPVDPAKVFLLGFSMGTMMSYSLLLTKPDLIAGVVANSGYIPEEIDLPRTEAFRGKQFQWDKLEGKSVFIAHGIQDPVIPVQWGRRSKELFSQTRANVLYKEYPMGHEISEESLGDLSRWLTQRLDGVD